MRVWDVRTGAPLSVPFDANFAVNAVAFSPDSQRIVSGSVRGLIQIWDVRTGPASVESTARITKIFSKAMPLKWKG